MFNIKYRKTHNIPTQRGISSKYLFTFMGKFFERVIYVMKCLDRWKTKLNNMGERGNNLSL